MKVCQTIRTGTKEAFHELVNRLKSYTETEREWKTMEDAADYICSNWSAAKRRLQKKERVVICSAEGRVSHVLSARMSMAPVRNSKI